MKFYLGSFKAMHFFTGPKVIIVAKELLQGNSGISAVRRCTAIITGINQLYCNKKFETTVRNIMQNVKKHETMHHCS